MNQAPLFWPRQLVVDLFAGGAGASTGLAQAIGRHVDIAVNHDPEAMMVHRANHPETMHYGGDVFDIDPRKVVRGQRVWILWASPSCTTHSRARTKEGPLDQQSRTGGDVVVRWAREVRPRFIFLENVTDWIKWGPCHPLDHYDERMRGRPIAGREGEDFDRMIRSIQDAGYSVDMRRLKAHHFGVPTSRERLFIVCRADRKPIVWPEPTHGPGLLPFETVRNHIDWSNVPPSIFAVGRSLVEATHRRIARGLVKFGYTHLVTKGYGEHKTQPPRAMDVDAPLTTIVASGVKHQVVTAFIAKHFGGKGSPGSSIDAPLGAITTKDHNSLVVGRRETSAERRVATRAWLDHYVGNGAFPEIEDIGMRVLTPRELFNCQGFPPDYIIDPAVRGKGLSPTSQVRLVGNSVPPAMARVVVQANIASEIGEVAA